MDISGPIRFVLPSSNLNAGSNLHRCYCLVIVDFTKSLRWRQVLSTQLNPFTVFFSISGILSKCLKKKLNLYNYIYIKKLKFEVFTIFRPLPSFNFWLASLYIKLETGKSKVENVNRKLETLNWKSNTITRKLETRNDK